MLRHVRFTLLFPLLAAAWIAPACGGSPSAPSDSSSGGTPAGFSYVGSVSLTGGVGGVLVVTTRAASASLDAPAALTAWLDLIEPRLGAQSAVASGALTLDNGIAVALSGTQSGSTFQLSGTGGYGVNADSSGGALSGTVTSPLGTGLVAPMGFAAPANPPPANPAGDYVGTYTMTGTGRYSNWAVGTGLNQRDCGYTVATSGTLTLRVESTAPQGRVVDMNDDWRDTARIGQPCPNVADFTPIEVRPPGPSGGTFFSDLNNLQLGDVDRGEVAGGVNVRTTVFVGALSGTTMQGTFVKTSSFVGITATGTSEHREGYRAEMTITLQKR